jgi:hypothetical protein
MKQRMVPFLILGSIIGLAALSGGLIFLWGYHEGDKRAACWVSDLESYQFQEVPENGEPSSPEKEFR